MRKKLNKYCGGIISVIARDRTVYMRTKLAFTGGGTGGHVYPALSVIEQLPAAYKSEVYWIGSRQGMEREIINREGLRYFPVFSGKLRRYVSFRNFLDMFKVLFAVVQSIVIFLRDRPGVLFSKGGYVSVPPVMAASILRIPVICHESDMSPGLATRIAARFAKRILVSYSRTKDYFPAKCSSRIAVTGVPVRSSIIEGSREEGLAFLGRPDKPVLLVLGGSLGSKIINDCVDAALNELKKLFYVVHQRGSNDGQSFDTPGYTARVYFHDELAPLIAACDFVVSRAGATGLWEFGKAGKVLVLVPLGSSASRGDQLQNAEYFEKMNAAITIREEELEPAVLIKTLSSLRGDPRKADSMRTAVKKLCGLDSSRIIADMLIQEADN